MSQVGESIAVKIQKLLAAAQSPNEAEATAAMRFAQALMRKYNLDFATIQDTAASIADVREKVQVDRTARYLYQRNLWETLAKVNYCWYEVLDIWESKGERSRPKKRHSILGRRSNVIMVRQLGEYLEDTMARLTADLQGSAAITWRNGCTDRLVERLLADFNSIEGVKGGTADSKALVLKSLSDREYAGNYDFQHGDGAWARQLAADEKYERERIEAEEQAEKEWLAYLASESEGMREARKAAEERSYRRTRRYYYSRATGARDDISQRAAEKREAKRSGNEFYRAGSAAGEKVSLSKQIKSSSRKALK